MFDAHFAVAFGAYVDGAVLGDTCPRPMRRGTSAIRRCGPCAAAGRTRAYSGRRSSRRRAAGARRWRRPPPKRRRARAHAADGVASSKSTTEQVRALSAFACREPPAASRPRCRRQAGLSAGGPAFRAWRGETWIGGCIRRGGGV
jgi:hypothetical protein